MNLSPILNQGIYVYVTVNDIPAGCDYLCMFREQECITLIMSEQEALSLEFKVFFRAAWITISLNTGLDETGITAVISTALYNADISCNIVAAAHHDHLFVPYERGEEACRIIEML